MSGHKRRLARAGRDEVAAIIEHTVSSFGRIDAAFNNAQSNIHVVEGYRAMDERRAIKTLLRS